MSFCAKRKYLQENNSKEHYKVATVLNIKLRGQKCNFCDLGSKMLDTLEFPTKLPIHIHVNIQRNDCRDFNNLAYTIHLR